ncbi:MAG: hypothetical protein QM783_09495 [Phycisphaerales bacterium]
MSHPHSHTKHKGQHAGSPRDKESPIGMVKQRAGLATFLVLGCVILFALGVLALVAFWLFG